MRGTVSTQVLERPPIDTWQKIFGAIGVMLLYVLAVGPWLVGYLIGSVEYAAYWIVAASVEGYSAGRHARER